MPQPYFFIKTDGLHVKILLSDVLYVEALKNYVRIVTLQKNWLALVSMKQAEQVLPVGSFCRIHRSFIVSLDHLSSFDRQTARVQGRTLPIGESYRDALEQHVVLLGQAVHKPIRSSEVTTKGILHLQTI